MKNKKETLITKGRGGMTDCIAERIKDFVDKNDIDITKPNAFLPEPTMTISDPYRKFREEIRDMKYFEKPKSKFHK